MRKYILQACFLGVLLSCVANPRPDIPVVDLPTIDTSRVRVDLASGHNQLTISGLEMAAAETAITVTVQNLLTQESVQVPVASDGSFVVSIEGSPTQVMALSQTGRDSTSDVVFIGGNAQREAVEIGDGEECEVFEDPREGECLVCRFEENGEIFEEVVGCSLNDFSDEVPINPANVAECLFLSEVEFFLEPDQALIEAEGVDHRFGSVGVFNGCGEVILIEVAELFTDTPERFFINPEPAGEPIIVEPTFFQVIDFAYDGTDRDPEEDFEDVAEAIIVAHIPVLNQESAEFEEFEELGAMILLIIAPPR